MFTGYLSFFYSKEVKYCIIQRGRSSIWVTGIILILLYNIIPYHTSTHFLRAESPWYCGMRNIRYIAMRTDVAVCCALYTGMITDIWHCYIYVGYLFNTWEHNCHTAELCDKRVISYRNCNKRRYFVSYALLSNSNLANFGSAGSTAVDFFLGANRFVTYKEWSLKKPVIMSTPGDLEQRSSSGSGWASWEGGRGNR